MSTDPTQWIKASCSGGTGNCVEMRRNDDRIEVRDTKALGTGPSLLMAPGEFAAWVAAAKSGELDHLA